MPLVHRLATDQPFAVVVRPDATVIVEEEPGGSVVVVKVRDVHQPLHVIFPCEAFTALIQASRSLVASSMVPPELRVVPDLGA